MKTFLKAEWRKLALANYEIDPALLLKYLPVKTELDFWNNKCYVSLVGFMFLNTSIKGFRIPYHINFEEVNLRFYVTYTDDRGLKRGVVFIKEIVPRAALTLVANTLYGEHYQTLPMRHQWENLDDSLRVEYQWKLKQKWNSIKVVGDFRPQNIITSSEEEFITEHFWGYTKINSTTTSEYEVEHPRWVVYPIRDYQIDVEFGDLYGKEFEFLKREKPVSVFLAEGSEIAVKSGRLISR
jgi:uncharacterized protein